MNVKIRCAPLFSWQRKRHIVVQERGTNCVSTKRGRRLIDGIDRPGSIVSTQSFQPLHLGNRAQHGKTGPQLIGNESPMFVGRRLQAFSASAVAVGLDAFLKSVRLFEMSNLMAQLLRE